MNQLFLEAQLFRHHPIPFDDIIVGDLVIMWLTNMKQCLLTWPSQKLKRLSHSWSLHRNKITNIKTQVKTYNDTWTHRVPGRNCVRTLWEVFAAPAGGLGWVPNTEMGGHSSLWLLLQETSLMPIHSLALHQHQAHTWRCTVWSSYTQASKHS